MKDFDFSNELISKLMGKELGSTLAESTINKLGINQDFITRRLFAPDVKKYFNVDNDQILDKLIQQFYPFKKQTLNYNPMDGPQEERIQLYLPFMSLLTFCIVTSIVNCEHGDFKISQLNQWVMCCLVFNFLDALAMKIGLIFVQNNSIQLLRVFAVAGYRFCGFTLIVLSKWLGIFLLKWALVAYLALTAVINYNNLLNSLTKSREGMKNQTIKKGLCCGHLGISLLILLITGGI